MGLLIELPNEYFAFTKSIDFFRNIGIPANIHPSLIFSLSRALSGLTGEDVATATGVSRQYISLIENGKKYPSYQFMNALGDWSCDHILSDKEYLFFVLIYLFVRPYIYSGEISYLEPELLYDNEDSVYISFVYNDDVDSKEHASYFFGTVVSALLKLFDYNLYLEQTIRNFYDFPTKLNKYNFILLSKLAKKESMDLTFTYHKLHEKIDIPTRIITTSPMLAWVSGNISADPFLRFLLSNQKKPFIISDISSNQTSIVSNVYFLSLFLFQEIKITFDHLLASNNMIAINNYYVIDKSDFTQFEDLDIELISTPIRTEDAELNRKRRRKTKINKKKAGSPLNKSDSELKSEQIGKL